MPEKNTFDIWSLKCLAVQTRKAEQKRQKKQKIISILCKIGKMTFKAEERKRAVQEST